jgi:hypothetical protein
MAMVSYVLDPLHPPTEHDQLADALSEAAITAAAHADPDNPPLSTGELKRIAVARSIKKLRRQRSACPRRRSRRATASRSRRSGNGSWGAACRTGPPCPTCA